MNVGMLWFDNDPRTALMVKVERAADYYRHKYGQVPDLCLVHPSMLAEPLLTCASTTPSCVRCRAGAGKAGKKFAVTVRPNRLVLPGHLWIGIEDKN